MQIEHPESRSSSASGDDLAIRVRREFERLVDLSSEASELAFRGRFLTTDCLVGSVADPVLLTISAGRVVAATPEPGFMRSWRFALRAAPAVWAEFWRPIPRPGFHDLLAMMKQNDATIEGDLHPFLSNLQFFKDLLALPRGHFSGGAS
jgi:hypothetical protein